MTSKPKLPPELMMLPIEKLRPAPWNFKEDDDEKAKKLYENLKRNGQVKNCNVRELPDGSYEVIDGNHRLMAFKELGIKYVLAYNHGPISQDEAIKLAHEFTEYFEVDPVKQGRALKLALDAGLSLEELVETVPFSLEELGNAIELSEFDWESLLESATEPEPSEAETPVKLTLEFASAEDAALAESFLDSIAEKASIGDKVEKKKRHALALLWLIKSNPNI